MQVISTLPNQAELCDGITYTRVAGGMISEDISEEACKRLCTIPGYEMYEEKDSGSGKGSHQAQGKQGKGK